MAEHVLALAAYEPLEWVRARKVRDFVFGAAVRAEPEAVGDGGAVIAADEGAVVVRVEDVDGGGEGFGALEGAEVFGDEGGRLRGGVVDCSED